MRDWTEKNAVHSRRRNRAYKLAKKYGITTEDYDRMFVQQNGRCLICGRDDEKLVVDHNHATGEVRGLLCDKCNRGLGHFNDDPKLLRLASEHVA